MKKIYLALATAITLFSACTKNSDTPELAGQTTITVDTKVGNSDFALNTDYTIEGKTYKFNKLRYWISNVSVVTSNGTEYKVPNSYFLMEETSAVPVQEGDYTYPANKRESITVNNIPAGDYKTVKFSIGVDAKYNDNLSLQAGELSQLSGMTNISWMWHTSYIFTALGGTVTQSGTSKTIKAETGLNANYKSVTLTLPTAIRIGSSNATQVNFALDVTKLLQGIDLFTTPTIGAAQATAMTQLATNYTNAFSFVSAQ